jgi:hypothetical protein
MEIVLRIKLVVVLRYRSSWNGIRWVSYLSGWTSAAVNASLSVSPISTTTYYLRAESTTGAPCPACCSCSKCNNYSQSTLCCSYKFKRFSFRCNGSSTTITQTGGSLGTGASWKWYSNAGYTAINWNKYCRRKFYPWVLLQQQHIIYELSKIQTPCTANVRSESVTVIVNQTSVAPSVLITFKYNL